jgi:hypothetical protein
MLHMIKQVHNLVYPSNFDVIMTWDLYQDPHVQNSWIFKPKIDGFNIFENNF